MAHTAEVLEKLNSRTRAKLEWLKSQYQIVKELGDAARHRQQCRTYIVALEDADVITESEGRMLFAYITL